MSEELIKYFLDWGLEWLIPAGFENEIKEIKGKLNEIK